jgi:hypothetical protein
MASIPWQSSIHNSLKTDPSEVAKEQMPSDVSREHWLRLIDLSAGAEETRILIPASENRYAPFNDNEANAGKLFGQRAKVVDRI